MTKADRKRAYKSLVDAVRTILRRHDPLHLIRMGAPLDEYDLEVGRIIPELHKQNSGEEVSRLVQQVFAGLVTAETAGPQSAYVEAANEIWMVWEQFNASGAVVLPPFTGEVSLKDLKDVVDAFVLGDIGYWTLHGRFMDVWMGLGDDMLSGSDGDTWDEIYELVYMGSDDPVPSADRAVGVIGESELRMMLSRLVNGLSE